LEELSFPQLMDIAKTIIGARSDPKVCYQYIDDEKTIRLDKILGLPNPNDLNEYINKNLNSVNG